MPNYLGMLNSQGIFRRPGTLGMPNIGDVDGFDEAMSAANEMKHNDMNRQREMMRFQEAMRVREEQRAMMNEALHRNERSVFGPVNKQRIVQQAPLTSMQQKFRQDEVAETGNKFKLGQIRAEEAGKLSTALAAGKQRDEGDMARLTAELNSREKEGAASRASAEKVAADELAARTKEAETERSFKSKEATAARTDKGWSTVNMTDPNDPTKQIAVRVNNATGETKPLQLDNKTVGGISKPGTKPLFPGADPKMESIRNLTQSALDELDQLMTPDGKLQPHTATATGKSRIPGMLANKVGMGSFTPESTKGSTGINALKSKLVLDLIGQMKAQSKTGATGFGNMSNKDLAVLERAASKLNEDLDDDTFAAELNRIRDKLRLVMQPGPDEVKAGKDETDKRSRADQFLQKHGYK